jgi:hypothetical protein
VDSLGLEPRLPSKEENSPGTNFNTVKLGECNYQLRKDKVRDWLGPYSKIIGPIQEVTFVDDEKDEADNGNGNCNVKMKLNREMPNVTHMFDQCVRIHYKVITKMYPKLLL